MHLWFQNCLFARFFILKSAVWFWENFNLASGYVSSAACLLAKVRRTCDRCNNSSSAFGFVTPAARSLRQVRHGSARCQSCLKPLLIDWVIATLGTVWFQSANPTPTRRQFNKEENPTPTRRYTFIHSSPLVLFYWFLTIITFEHWWKHDTSRVVLYH